MPRASNGTVTLPANSANPAVPLTRIESADWNAVLGDVQAELTDSLSRSGKGTMTSALNMGGFAISNVNGPTTRANLGLAAAQTARIMARITAGAGDWEAATLSQVLDLIGGAAQGDILYRGAAGWARLPAGTSGQFLKTQGAGANPVYDSIPGGGDMLAANNLSDLANKTTALGILLAGSSPVAGFRNKIINPKLAINQRAVSGTVTLASGAYGHDRFKAGAGGCTYNFSTSNGITTLTISAGTIQQIIEGANLESGTYYLSWAGTAQGRISLSGTYGASPVSSVVAGGSNLAVEWGVGTLSTPQLERDFVTVFASRDIQLEMLLCQRYCRVLGAGAFGRWVNASTVDVGWQFVLPMRAVPTAAIVGAPTIAEMGLAGRTVTGIAAGTWTVNGGYANFNGSSGATAGALALSLSEQVARLTAEL